MIIIKATVTSQIENYRYFMRGRTSSASQILFGNCAKNLHSSHGNLDALAPPRTTPLLRPSCHEPMSQAFRDALHDAASAPSRPALWNDSYKFDWKALKARVDSTASALGALVQKQCRVGIAISGGVNLVVAELACSVLGVGFVPLDPSLPTARLRYLCEDASIGCIVIEDSIAVFKALGMEVCLQGNTRTNSP